MGNNPILNIDPLGDTYDKKNNRKAKKDERKLRKETISLAGDAKKLEAKGQDVTEIRARQKEIAQSLGDYRDMRADQTTEYRFEKLNAQKTAPVTSYGGTNSIGQDIVIMYANTMGNKIHETRHGGQNARGEFSVKNPQKNYGVADEVSAYRAEYSFTGFIDFIDVNKNPTMSEILKSSQEGTNPLMNTVNSIKLINASFVNSLVDPGLNKIYPPKGISLKDWNSN